MHISFQALYRLDSNCFRLPKEDLKSSNYEDLSTYPSSPARGLTNTNFLSGLKIIYRNINSLAIFFFAFSSVFVLLFGFTFPESVRVLILNLARPVK